MKNFIEFLDEEAKKGTLHVFDVDDTLFHTTAKVRVRNSVGKIIRYLSNKQFNDYRLRAGEKFDFGEFKSARKFRGESKPIQPMIGKMNKIQNKVSTKPNSRVIINTARTDLDDKHEFLKKFREHGVDIDKIHVHRAGNIPGDDIPALKKVKIVKAYIDKYSHKKVVMYDDSKTNLNALLGMKREYPDVQFIAFHVKPDGSMVRHKQGDK